MIDLHLHTCYSDGRNSPAEIVQAAAERRLRAIAITDHDNARGMREALPLAAEAKIELVTGIELTTRWPEAGLPPENQNVDLLGYLFDPDDPGMRALEVAMLADLHDRIAETCAGLNNLGCPLTISDVFAENPRYGGPIQVIHALLHKGLAPGWNEALRRFESVWLKIRPPALTIQQGISAIHRAGGLAVLAHPSIVRPNGQTMDAGWLEALVEAGLDGIEVYHYRLDHAARSHFLKLARRFDLAVTGGSDMHGWNNELAQIGSLAVADAVLERIKQRRTA